MSGAHGSGAGDGGASVAEALDDPGPASEAALALARGAGLTFTVADALSRRGLDDGVATNAFLAPRLADLTPPDAMADLEAAAERIARAIEAGERIVVFGDYDCDGVTSTAIVTEVIAALGGDVRPMLASRFEGGYGFSAPALERVFAAKAQLLVTCDCGSSDHPRLARAQQAGVDTVVIDHHLVPDDPLPAVAFLNPHRPECGFPYKGLASCGLALFLATALRKRLGKRLDVRRWLDLVAIGTIADVAPLTGDNRVLVRAGLSLIARGEDGPAPRPGLVALQRAAGRGRVLPMSAEDVAFQLAPRLNAPGRLASPQLSLDTLMARNPVEAVELAEAVERMSNERRAVQQTIVAEAIAEVGEKGYADDPCIVLARQGWHPGVVGIVAGRISSRFGRPTVVVALEGESGRGSARCPEGFRLYDALAACHETLLKFGGHQAAAGVEVAADGVDRFRDAWREACAEQLAGAPPAPDRAVAEVRLDPRDDLMAVLGDLERVEPCGEANPAIKLLIRDVEVRSARAIKVQHLKVDLTLRGRRLRGFAPDLGALESAVVGGTFDVVARLKRDHWNGGHDPELLVERFAAPAGR